MAALQPSSARGRTRFYEASSVAVRTSLSAPGTSAIHSHQRNPSARAQDGYEEDDCGPHTHLEAADGNFLRDAPTNHSFGQSKPLYEPKYSLEPCGPYSSEITVASRAAVTSAGTMALVGPTNT